MPTQPSQKKRLEWWEFALLGLVPTFLGALSLAIYLLGKNWNRFLVDAVVSAGVLTFVSCLALTLFKLILLCRERRWTMAFSGLVLYVASASTVVLGMLYVLL